MKNKPAPADSEADKPYSTMLTAAGTFAGTVGRAFPLLSSIVGPTEWFLRAASKAVSAFGYAKPIEVRRPERSLLTLTSNQHNCDGYEPVLNMGFTADTAVGLMSLAGLPYDEMSLDFLKSVDSRFASFLFNKGSGRDSVLWTYDQKMSAFHDTEAVTPYRASTMPMFLANFNRYWRGDLVLTFTAIRTQFHSGKLLIGFIPYNSDNDTVPSVADVLDYHSVVWDISTQKSLEFTLPFTSSTAWSTFDKDNGQVFVSIVSPLVCPDNVAQSVSINVSVRCANNFCVAAPGPLQKKGAYAPSPTAEWLMPSNTVFYGAAAQAALPYNTISSEDAELYCIGNALRSVKQMLSKNEPLNPYARINITDPAVTEWVLDWIQNAHEARTQATNSPHALVLGAYGLHRGGWAMTAYSENPDNLIEVQLDPVTTVRGRGIVSVVAPFYNATTRSIQPVSKPLRAYARHELFFDARAADDFQLGMFTHTPWLKVA